MSPFFPILPGLSPSPVAVEGDLPPPEAQDGFFQALEALLSGSEAPPETPAPEEPLDSADSRPADPEPDATAMVTIPLVHSLAPEIAPALAEAPPVQAPPPAAQIPEPAEAPIPETDLLPPEPLPPETPITGAPDPALPEVPGLSAAPLPARPASPSVKPREPLAPAKTENKAESIDPAPPADPLPQTDKAPPESVTAPEPTPAPMPQKTPEQTPQAAPQPAQTVPPSEPPTKPQLQPQQTPAPAAPSALSAHTVENIAALSAQITRRMTDKTAHFDMQLKPADQGQVDVRLEISAEGKLSAHMSFDSPLSESEFRGRQDELRRQLEQAGFQMDKDSLSFSSRERRQESPPQPRERAAPPEPSETADAPIASTLPRSYALARLDGLYSDGQRLSLSLLV